MISVTILALAVVASALYATFAIKIFDAPEPTSASGWIHQFWFNFCGSMLGWAALMLLISKFSVAGTKLPDVGFWDIVLAFVAFAGVTGHLPMVFAEFKNVIAIAAKRLLG